MPNRELATFTVEHANKLYEEANKLGQATKKKNDAILAIQEAERQWRPIVEAKTPLENTALGGINIDVHAYKLLLDTKRFRNNVQRAVNNQLLVGGVRVINGPAIPGVTDQDAPNSILASYYNYPAIPFPVVMYDLGQVTVTGTYDQIIKNYRSWSNMPRYLASVHNLQLTGTAPQLTGTYNLSIVGYIRYNGIFAAVPDGVGAAPAGPGAPAGGRPVGAGGGPPPGVGTSVPGGRPAGR
ncbi:MAG TPA: hypothetical protein VK171_05160 [Fimbriimonas sp.]|nr:hypothetical protein [Fimbriimonas sp.]